MPVLSAEVSEPGIRLQWKGVSLLSVIITYPHAGTVSHSFAYSLMRTVQAHADKIHSVYPTRGFPGDGLIRARNAAVKHLLSSDAEWLWTLDTDIGFPAGCLARLLAHTGTHRIVSGLYYTVLERGDDGMGAPSDWRPLPLAMKRVGNGFQEYGGYTDGLMEVDGVGAGCLLVHRDVFTSIGDDGWYDLLGTWGEDFSFCVRAADAGHKILCDPTIPLTHHKQIWLRTECRGRTDADPV